MPLVTPGVGIVLSPEGHNLNKYNKGPLDDATY